jgi:hypothetical protein
LNVIHPAALCLLPAFLLQAGEERSPSIEELVARITLYCEHPNPTVELSTGELVKLFSMVSLVKDVRRKGVAVLSELAGIAKANPRLARATTGLYIDMGIDFARGKKVAEKRPSELTFAGERIVAVFGTGEVLISCGQAPFQNGQTAQLLQACTRWLRDTYPSLYGGESNILPQEDVEILKKEPQK